MGEKPAEGTRHTRRTRSGIEETQEPRFEDYCRIATGKKSCFFPTTVSKGAEAVKLAEFTPSAMLRAVTVKLQALSLLPSRKATKVIDRIANFFTIWHAFHAAENNSAPQGRAAAGEEA